jgi:predicted dehydrogenase
MAETFNDRQSSLGAWNYSIPTDASKKTIDWKAFLGDAPKRDYDAKRFFRWRNYNDYGTGVAGDLFVHLFSGLHVILDTMGPNRIYASGGLRYWKDGRDAPDLMLAVVDYGETKTHPAFNLQIRVNFVDGGGGGGMTKLIGSEGTLTLGGNSITIKKNKISDAPGYGGWDSFATFTKAQQKDYEKWYNEKYPTNYEVFEPSEQIFQAPRGYSSHVNHFANFFDAMRNGNKVVEDGSFGLRAAGPALSTNLSYFSKQIVNWDPENMVVV